MTGKRSNGRGLPLRTTGGKPAAVSPEAAVAPDWWKRNILGLLAIAPVVVAGLRIVMFSRGDPALISALAQSIDVPTVLLAGIVPSMGVVWSYGLFVVVANREVTPVFGEWLRNLRPVPMTLFMIFQGVVLLTTTLRAALMFLVLPAVALLYRWVSTQMDKRSYRYIPADIPAIVAAFVLVGLMTWPPWVPAENVTMSDGTQRSAYVMATTEGWTTLVDTATRAVSRVPTGQVVKRDVCGADGGRTLLDVIVGGSPQPPCASIARTPPDPRVTPSPATNGAQATPRETGSQG